MPCRHNRLEVIRTSNHRFCAVSRSGGGPDRTTDRAIASPEINDNSAQPGTLVSLGLNDDLLPGLLSSPARRAKRRSNWYPRSVHAKARHKPQFPASTLGSFVFRVRSLAGEIVSAAGSTKAWQSNQGEQRPCSQNSPRTLVNWSQLRLLKRV